MSEQRTPPFIIDSNEPEQPGTENTLSAKTAEGITENNSISAPREEPERRRRRGSLDNSISAPREEPERRRRRGAQPGNNNAVKYGFYARHLPHRDTDGLDATTVNSLKDEIEVMRIYSRKVAELGSDVEDLDKAMDMLRVLSLSTSSINRLVRTHSSMPDPELDAGAILRQALTELEDEWPEYKALCDSLKNGGELETPHES